MQESLDLPRDPLLSFSPIHHMGHQVDLCDWREQTSQTPPLRILELAGIMIYPPQPTTCPLCALILKDDGCADIAVLRPYCRFRPLSLFSDWYAMRPGGGTLRLERIGLWPCITLGH